MRVTARSAGLALCLAALGGCGGSTNWASKKAELIAETSLVTTTFEHKDAEFYERSGQLGLAWTPYVLKESEGIVSTPTIEMGAVFGEYGDEGRCCGHGQLGASWRFRVPDSDVVRAQLGPRAGITLGPVPDGDLPVTTHVGGMVGVAVLGGIASLDFKLDALIAHGSEGFAWREGEHPFIPRGGISVSTDFCAIFGGSACTHPEERSTFVDLSPQLLASAQRIRKRENAATKEAVCAAVKAALAADPWDSPAVRSTKESCPPSRKSCPVSEYDPPPTATHRFLAKAALEAEKNKDAPPAAAAALGQLLDEHLLLEQCLDTRRRIARDERRAGKVPKLHVVYGVYAPQIRKVLGCDGPAEDVVWPLRLDAARCAEGR
jgi:hypothetical protein